MAGVAVANAAVETLLDVGKTIADIITAIHKRHLAKATLGRQIADWQSYITIIMAPVLRVALQKDQYHSRALYIIEKNDHLAASLVANGFRMKYARRGGFNPLQRVRSWKFPHFNLAGKQADFEQGFKEIQAEFEHLYQELKNNVFIDGEQKAKLTMANLPRPTGTLERHENPDQETKKVTAALKETQQRMKD